LEQMPKMRLKILTRNTSPDPDQSNTELVYFKNPLFVEFLFDNETYLTERKEMPFWLVDVLEFAAKTLRAQYELNHQIPTMEEVDDSPLHD